MADKTNDPNNRDDSSRSHALTGSGCRVPHCVDGTIMEPMGTKLLTPFPCPRCNAPTHAVTVEVKFRVEVDVKAESEDEAMQMAEKKIQAKYDRELKSSMVGSPNRVDVEAEWADEYEDSQNTEPTRREPETHTNHKP